MTRKVSIRDYFKLVGLKTLQPALAVTLIVFLLPYFKTSGDVSSYLETLFPSFWIGLGAIGSVATFFYICIFALFYYITSSFLISNKYGRFSIVLCIGIFLSLLLHLVEPLYPDKGFISGNLLYAIYGSAVIYLIIGSVQAIVMFIVGEKGE